MHYDLVLKQPRIEIHAHLASSYRSEMIKDIFQGLTASQKFIPSKYLYDARGSQLFEEICSLPEYYLTRNEISILRYAAPKIMASFESSDLVELGSGANKKICIFLDSVEQSKLPRLRYVPVDVSETALVSASENLLKLYPKLEVFGIVADFTLHIDAIPCTRPRLVLFLGSTIGNFDEKDRGTFLRLVANSMKQGDRFLIGFDMLKHKKKLEAAYNDSRGVTSEFNKNVLNVLNRELNANFNPSYFDHVAFFNEEKERVEMHLQAKRKVEINISDLNLVIELNKDETIHTEICGKFRKAVIERMVHKAGLDIKQWFSDSKEWFSLVELTLKDS